MKLLVTGASGYLAEYVIEDLARDFELVLFSRHAPQAERVLAARAQFVAGDITVLDDCRRAVTGIDAVVHLAAIPDPGPDTFRVNALGTYTLLEAVRDAGVPKVVMASSNCTLGHLFRTSGRPFQLHYLPIDEQHPSQVEDNYGLSKVVGEVTLRAYAEAYEIQAVALRPSWCWGERERQARTSERFDPAANVDGFWAYIDMRDVAQAFRLAVEAPARTSPWWGAYFISAADTYADAPSRELLARYYPEFGELGVELADDESYFAWGGAHRALGFSPRYSWRSRRTSAVPAAPRVTSK